MKTKKRCDQNSNSVSKFAKSFQKQIDEHLLRRHAVLKQGENLNPHKRKVDTNTRELFKQKVTKTKKPLRASPPVNKRQLPRNRIQRIEDSDKKRLESLKRKRLDYMEQQLIIKSGLGSIVSLLLTV